MHFQGFIVHRVHSSSHRIANLSDSCCFYWHNHESTGLSSSFCALHYCHYCSPIHFFITTSTFNTYTTPKNYYSLSSATTHRVRHLLYGSLHRSLLYFDGTMSWCYIFTYIFTNTEDTPLLSSNEILYFEVQLFFVTSLENIFVFYQVGLF